MTRSQCGLWIFLHAQTPSGVPPHMLTLGPGVLLMLLRNLDIERGLCNGIRMIVIKALPFVLDVLVVSGTKAGSRVYMSRICPAPNTPDLPIKLRRRQFPVKLAWVMTINKAQGQTLSKVGIHLPKPVFSHGQLYVALSRVGSGDRVRVLIGVMGFRANIQVILTSRMDTTLIMLYGPKYCSRK